MQQNIDELVKHIESLKQIAVEKTQSTDRVFEKGWQSGKAEAYDNVLYLIKTVLLKGKP